MAAALSSNLVKAPEHWQGRESLRMGGEDLDFYETRGGMARMFHVDEACELDPYEMRGGMAINATVQLPKAPEHNLEFLELRFDKEGLDFYEARGGMAGMVREEAEVDVFEIRGGMAAKMWPQLATAPEHPMEVETVCVDGRELDLYETRGGMAEYLCNAAEAAASEPDVYALRGGMVTRFAGQLPQLPKHCSVLPGTVADGQEADFYELRGGMADRLLKEVKELDVDEYEARGGLSERTLPMLPVFQMKSGSAGEVADEGDEYEARGGQGAALYARLPLACQVA